MDKPKSTFAMPYCVVVASGTEGIQTLMKLLRVAEHYGTLIRHGDNSWIILMDDHYLSPRDMEKSPLGSQSASDLTAAFVEVGLVDKESRRRLHESGDLWFLQHQDIEDPGVCNDGVGTGNRPRFGRALTRMNRQPIEGRFLQGFHGFRDFERLWEGARKGEGDGLNRVLHIIIFVSPVGGFGSGSLPDVLGIINSCAARLQIRVKVHIIKIGLGTLYPANREVAVENRNNLTNLLRVMATHAYRDLEGDGVFEGPLFDSLTVSPNAGPNSQFSTLSAQEWFIAHQTYLRFYSPMGDRIREDVVDIDANVGNDDTGAPCVANAPGTSLIALCRGSYRAYCASSSVRLFANAVLKNPIGDVVVEAGQAAGELHLVESYAESLTVRRITQASGNEPDMSQEALGAFGDRGAGLSGVEALQAMTGSYDWVVRHLVPQIQQPRMLQRAANMLEGLGKRLAKEKAACAHELTGLRRMRGLVEELSKVVQASERINAEKLADLIQTGEGLHQEIDACRQRAEAYAHMGLVRRILHFFSILFTVRRLESLAIRDITLEVERTARTLMQEQVFLPARQLLAQELSYLTLLEEKLGAIANEAAREADACLKAKPSPHEVPMGISLADGASLKSFYSASVKEKGGGAKVIEQLQGTVTQGGTSMFALFEQPKEELEPALMNAAKGMFEADIAALNVLDVFRQRHGHAVTSILVQAVSGSRPWIRTEGEAGRHVPVVKLLGVPEGCDDKWLLDQLKKVDHSDDGWEVVKLPAAYDAIVLLTYRSGVSLTMLIKQQAAAAGHSDIESRVRNAADPLAAIIPDGKLTETQAGVVSCYAWCEGFLSRDGDNGWILNGAGGKTVPIGQAPRPVFDFFRAEFAEVVHVYSELGASLRPDGQAFLTRLRDLEDARLQDPKLGALISEQAISRAKTEVQLLLPFVKAVVRKERQK